MLREGVMRHEGQEITGVLLPLEFQFKFFFEKDDNLSTALNRIEDLEKKVGEGTHLILCPMWQNKSRKFRDAGKLVMPYYLYADDAEVNNPLGGHKCGVSFVYYSFPAMKYCDIFLACVFEAKLFKQFGAVACLADLVAVMQSLEEEGIDIDTSKGRKRVNFVLAMVLGDNKGLNDILGFAGSFTANFFCRFCNMHREVTQEPHVEAINLLRTRETYAIDCAAQDLKTTGIKSQSIFNSISSFHVVENYAVD